MSGPALRQEGRQSRSYKEIAAQLRVECRRATDFEQRAARAERAERDLAAELQRARERIAGLEHQVTEITVLRDRADTVFAGGTVAVIAQMQARQRIAP